MKTTINDRWWKLSRPNTTAMYGYGTLDQALRWCARESARDGLGAHLWSAQEASEEVSADLDSGKRDDGFDLCDPEDHELRATC